MLKEDYERLIGDIKAHGFDDTQPIITYKGEILDGWNRQKACDELNVKPVYKMFTGSDSEAFEYVMRTNKRRNLTAVQWACIANDAEELITQIRKETEREFLEKQKRAKQPENDTASKKLADDHSTRTDQKVAELFNTNREYIRQTAKIKREEPEAFEKIMSGESTLQEWKKQKKIEEYKNFTPKKLPNDKYQVIYIDPPWQYDKDEERLGQSVEKHYPTMTYEELMALDVKKYAYKNCVIYMWTTAPKLNVAIDLLRDWGFNYKTCLIWDKIKHNMGHYASIRHEILLIGGIGKSAPEDKSFANQIDSVYVEERTVHSKKPEYYYGMIEGAHPQKNKRIELFARQKKDGWESWGNEN